jgi:hypothetical protein
VREKREKKAKKGATSPAYPAYPAPGAPAKSRAARAAANSADAEAGNATASDAVANGGQPPPEAADAANRCAQQVIADVAPAQEAAS